MGNSNSSIAINLDRNDSFYFTNEIISGKVNLPVSYETLEANEVFMMFNGKVGYSTTHTVPNEQGGSTRRRRCHRIPFFSIKIPFLKPKIEGEEELILYEKEYSWPFEISLTDYYLPPSINQPLSYLHCIYCLELFVDDKSQHKRNKIETKYLTIYPHVNLLENPQCLRPSMFQNSNEQDIHLKGTINKLGSLSNESIILSIEINNPQKIFIKHINLTIIQLYNIQQFKLETILSQAILPKICDLEDEHIQETFSISTPSIHMAPTYQFRGGIGTSVSVKNSYLIRLAVKVDEIFSDFNVDIPIIIGTESTPDVDQQSISISIPSEWLYYGNDDPPPPYDSAVQNMK